MDKSNVMGVYSRYDLVLDHGEGAYVYDVNGKKYLDFVSGIAVNCLGHANPVIVETIEKQSRKLMHVSNLYWTENMTEFATALCDITGLDKVFFNNSGTEANETAMKIARRYGKAKGGDGKNKIIYMKESFHGRSLGSLSVTGQEKYQAPFRPLLGGTVEAVFNDIESLRGLIDKDTCAVIIEPVQGESGIITADPGYLKEVRALCDENDALLIFDEVQCGMGRSGAFYAYQKLGTAPDILTSAKGIGAGFPLSAVIASDKACEFFVAGDHGSTYGGNPLGCAIGLTVIDQLKNKGVLENVEKASEYAFKLLNELKEKNDVIEEVRGMGLLIGIQVKEGKKAGIIAKAMENGLLLVGAGHETIRFLPPLNVTMAEIEEGVKIFESSLE